MSFSGKTYLAKLLKYILKHFSCTFPPASGSKGVTEINGKEHELSFHPLFIHEKFTSLLMKIQGL